MATLLTRGWLGEREAIAILDEASVSLLRERVRAEGAAIGLERAAIESMAAAASELAHNQLRHARSGQVAVAAIDAGSYGLEVVAADEGDGILDPRSALQGAPRESGSLGVGLSAVRRLADEVDFDVRLGEGTCVWARKYGTPPARRREIAIFGRALPGERVSGDQGFFVRMQHAIVVGVADGLGHGAPARESSDRAIEVARLRAALPPDEILVAVDAALDEMRGVTMGVARLSRDAGALECAAIGDTALRVCRAGRVLSCTGRAGTLGVPARRRVRPKPETLELGPGDLVVLSTDGLKTALDPSAPELLHLPALVIAQELIARFARPTDDALVLVAR